jgi:MoxR-like ATPase
VQEQLHTHPLDTLEPGIDVSELRKIQAATEDVYIDPIIQRWLIELVRATRELEFVRVGASVRGSLALERAVRAWALIHGRSFVLPEDVEALLEPVLAHRVLLNPYSLDGDGSGDHERADLVRRCLELVARPGAELTDG